MSAGHIRSRSKGSWELKFDTGPRDPASGKRKIRYVSFRGTKRQAQVKLAELISAVGKGSFVEPSRLTVTEHVRARVDQWQAAGGISAKTAERYRELAEHQIVPHLGTKPLQKLTTLDLEQWHSTLRATLSARTIGHAHRILSHALGDAMRHGLIVQNVAAIERAPKVDEEEVQVVPKDRVGELIDKLRGRAMYARAITSLFTGMRRGELLAVPWHNSKLDAKVIEVRAALEQTRDGIKLKSTKTKAGKRDVTLPEIVVDALREHRRQQLELRMALGLGKMPDNAPVFPAIDGGYQNPRAFSKEWARVAASIGFPGITFHALRHTHASQLIDAGLDIVTISKRLGHAKPDITLRIYAHLFTKSDSKAADAINDALARLGG